MSADLLYHYTSFAAFRNIIKTRSLWATHASYLNDSQELRHAFALAEEYVNNRLPSSVESVEPLGTTISRLFSRARVTACVASLSEEADSLSQWRAYSQGGAGICIGFKAAIFQQLIAMHQPSSEHLFNCVYEEVEKRATIAEILSGPLENFLTSVSGSTRRQAAELVSAIVVPLILNAPRFKHSAFRDEKEWRFVRHASEEDSGAVRIANWQFRTCGSYLIPYLSLDLCEHEPLELAEVIIGPNPHAEEAIRSTDLFLKTSGVPYGGLRLSKAPFRFW